MHVVCAWLGNSERVAAKHYLQVTDAHFDEAQKTTRKTTQHASATPCNTSHPKDATSTITEKRDRSSVFASCKVGDEGLALSPDSSGKLRLGEASYAPEYAIGPDSQVIDQSLAEVVAAWRWLSDSAKSEISRVARSGQPEVRRP